MFGFDGEDRANDERTEGAQNAKTGPADTANAPAVEPEPEPVVRQHTLEIGGRTLAYTTTTGMMPIRNEKGEIEARLFFMAYTLDDPPDGEPRPLMFSFNGGA